MKQGTFTIITFVAALAIGILFYYVALPGMDKGVEETPLIHQITLAGPVVPVLITLTLMLLTFVVERVITLAKAKGTAALPTFFSNFTKAVREGRYQDATKLCDKQRGSAAAVLKAGAEQYLRTADDKAMTTDKRLTETQRAINEARLLEVPFLERNLIALSTIASIATMIGLLGHDDRYDPFVRRHVEPGRAQRRRTRARYFRSPREHGPRPVRRHRRHRRLQLLRQQGRPVQLFDRRSRVPDGGNPEGKGSGISPVSFVPEVET